jgi:hypothetical protein
MVRVLRSAVWISSLLACLVAGALWLRTNSWADSLLHRLPGRYWAIYSYSGLLVFKANAAPETSKAEPEPIRLSRIKAEQWDESMRTARLLQTGRSSSLDEEPSFAWTWRRGEVLHFSMPFWLLVSTSGAIAVAAKPRPRWRFSLCDLIVGMTLITVVAGGLAAFVRTIAINPV